MALERKSGLRRGQGGATWRERWLALSTGALAVLAAVATGPSDARAACTILPAATLPLSLKAGHFITAIRVGGAGRRRSRRHRRRSHRPRPRDGRPSRLAQGPVSPSGHHRHRWSGPGFARHGDRRPARPRTDSPRRRAHRARGLQRRTARGLANRRHPRRRYPVALRRGFRLRRADASSCRPSPAVPDGSSTGRAPCRRSH